MAWTNGGRGSKIPANTKRAVRHRQGDRCTTHDPTICVGTINEFDHIINVKAARVDRHASTHPDLIQGLCTPCHKAKTQGEALAGRMRGHRPPTPHLGLQ